MEYAGMHWPNGPEDQRIVELPSPLLLMLSSEARYHYDPMRQLGKTVIWRALPREGQRPAEIGWKKYAKNVDEVMNLWDEQPHYGEEWFVPYNELDLNYERGDSENDFENIPDRLQKIANFLAGIYPALRQRLPNETHILFPPFTPDHGCIENVERWKDVAEMYEGIVIHAYGNAENVRNIVSWYCEQFPTKPIFLGEWNADDPESVLTELASLMGKYSNFRGATYFCWHWFNAPGYWPDHYNVDMNPDLLALFQRKESRVNDVQWPPDRPAKTIDEVVSTARSVAKTKNIPQRLLLALLYAESGFRWNAARYAYRSNGTFVNLTQQAEQAIAHQDASEFKRILDTITNAGSNDISFGVGQQTVRWSNFGDQTQSVDNTLRVRNYYFDIVNAINEAGKQIAYYYTKYPDILEALCRYNSPSTPGANNSNRGNYQNAMNAVSPYVLDENMPTPPVMSIKVIQARTPNIAGTMANPKGCILHGSRSGVKGNPKAKEAAGTSSYCVSNTGGLGWTATIGEDEYYVHMNANEWGWNAYSASNKYIAVEFAQATVDEPISDAQVRAFVHFWNNVVKKVFPNIPNHFPTHSDVEASGETVQTSGKTDVFPLNDPRTVELQNRIMNLLGGTQPMPEHQFHFGFEAKANELGRDVVGEPLEDETYITDNYSLQLTENGLMIYSKAANTVKFLEGR